MYVNAGVRRRFRLVQLTRLQLRHDPVGIVDHVQRRPDRPHVHHHVPALFRQVDEVAGQPLDVPIEVEPYQLQLRGHRRRARVAAISIGCGGEVERRAQVEPRRRRTPALRQFPLAVRPVGDVAIVHAKERGVRRRLRTVVPVALHHAIGDARRKRAVRRNAAAVHVEAGTAQLALQPSLVLGEAGERLTILLKHR